MGKKKSFSKKIAPVKKAIDDFIRENPDIPILISCPNDENDSNGLQIFNGSGIDFMTLIGAAIQVCFDHQDFTPSQRVQFISTMSNCWISAMGIKVKTQIRDADTDEKLFEVRDEDENGQPHYQN